MTDQTLDDLTETLRAAQAAQLYGHDPTLHHQSCELFDRGEERVHKLHLFRFIHFPQRATDTGSVPCAASVIERRQIERAQARGISDHIDRDDLSVCKREGEDDQ